MDKSSNPPKPIINIYRHFEEKLEAFEETLETYGGSLIANAKNAM